MRSPIRKDKPAARKGKIVLVNASKRVQKGRPKNYIPEADIKPIASLFNTAETVEGEVEVITREQAVEADYNLSPSRWVDVSETGEEYDLAGLFKKFVELSREGRDLDAKVEGLLKPLMEGLSDA